MKKDLKFLLLFGRPSVRMLPRDFSRKVVVPPEKNEGKEEKEVHYGKIVSSASKYPIISEKKATLPHHSRD